MTVVRGGTVLTPHRLLEDHALVIHGERVAAVLPAAEAPPPAAGDVDAAGGWVAPGFVDVHVHGGGGHDTMDATHDALAGMSAHLARHGVTAFLATTVSASREAIADALAAIAEASDLPGARLLGAHLEGPYLNPDHRGAQDPAALRLPAPAEYEAWFARGPVRMMTLAPELDGALELIRAGRARGVRFSAGHSGAAYEELVAAADAGLAHATHTFNGMPPLHHREPGLVGGVLTDERIIAEVIADGVHVHPAVVRLLVQAKGPDRVVLVSDAIRATGMPDGTYALGGQEVAVRDGVCRTAAGSLAGSTLTLDRAVANLVEQAGVPLPDAVCMATATPAAVLGGLELGALTTGARADVVVLDSRLRVRTTVVAGEIVYAGERTST